MASRARPTTLKGPGLRIRHVAHVIRRVEVFAIPAGWEPHVCHDASRARLSWEVHGLGEPGAKVLETCVRDLPETSSLLLAPVGRFTDEHAESLLESSYLGGLLVVGQPILHIVYGHSSVGALEADVGNLRNSVVGAIAGTEEKHGGPVVGEVFGELAGCACGLLSDVFLRVHGDVEGILGGRLVTGAWVIEGMGKSLTPPMI